MTNPELRISILVAIMTASGEGKFLLADVITEKDFDGLGFYGCEQIAKRFAHNGGFTYYGFELGTNK